MTDLPLELHFKVVSAKVTPAAWAHAQWLKDETGARMCDIVSACLLFMPMDLLEHILERQSVALEAIPKPVQAILKSAGELDPQSRAMVIAALSGPTEK